MLKYLNIILLIAFAFTSSGCVSPAKRNIESAISNNNLGVLDSYTDHSYITSTAKPDVAGGFHRSAMEAAIQQRSLPAVKKLVALGANRESVYRYHTGGFTDSHYATYPVSAAELACSGGALNITDFLVEQFPEEKVDYSRCLFAHFYLGHTWFVADLSSELALQETPAANRFYSVRPHLQKKLTKYQQPDYMRELINRGADIKRLDDLISEFGLTNKFHHGLTFGEYVVYGKNDSTGPEVAKILIESGADPDRFWMWIEEAIVNDDKRLTDLALTLLDKGFDPNNRRFDISVTIPTDDGVREEPRQNFSYLHQAAYFGRAEMYKALVQHGADPMAIDSQGFTPMSYDGWHEKSEAHKRRISSQAQPIAQQKNSNTNIFGKALAIGLGAAAIGSLDVSSELAIESMGALTSDILSDNGGENLRNMQQQSTNTSLNQTSSRVAAAGSSGVDNCTQEAREKYSNIYRQCFPIVAKCWGWGDGEDAVYEYCSEREMNKRGGKINPSDKDSKDLWNCGGRNADC